MIRTGEGIKISFSPLFYMFDGMSITGGFSAYFNMDIVRCLIDP